MHIFPRVLATLRRQRADDIAVFGGGVISPDDAAQLKAQGVAEIFGQDSPLQSIVDWVRGQSQRRSTGR